MTLAILDGDILAFRAAAACQKTYDWGEGSQSSHANSQESADTACYLVDAWTRLAGCTSCLVTFTGRENWRKRILPTYKANRAGKVKPMAYAYTVQAVTERFNTQLIEGLEADDLMGILATTLPKYEGAVVVTLDKDLRTVPGLHLNPLKEQKAVTVSSQEADFSWMMQTLTGDTSDGYVGIPGVGPKKAYNILTERTQVFHASPNLWNRVVAAYRAAKLTEADALVQARVARILRREDYDKATKEILLWSPTTPQRMALESKGALKEAA